MPSLLPLALLKSGTNKLASTNLQLQMREVGRLPKFVLLSITITVSR